jgi:hypothetical protein
MTIDPAIGALIVVNSSTLLSVVVLGLRIVRHASTIEAKVDLMWETWRAERAPHASASVPS